MCNLEVCLKNCKLICMFTKLHNKPAAIYNYLKNKLNRDFKTEVRTELRFLYTVTPLVTGCAAVSVQRKEQKVKNAALR